MLHTVFPCTPLYVQHIELGLRAFTLGVTYCISHTNAYNIHISPDMHTMQVSSGHTVMHNSDNHEHNMSAMHAAASMHQYMHKHCCCHDCKNNCSGGCDLGVSLSLLQQVSFYSPVYESFLRPVTLTSKILFRELEPPSRPPATLHS